MIALLVFVGIARAVPMPMVTRTAVIFPAASSGAAGEQRVVVRHLRFARRVVHEMSTTGPAGADRRLVIPPSLAASFDAGIELWAHRLVQKPGGLATSGCAHPVTLERAARRTRVVDLCLDALDRKARGQFVTWANQLAATLE